MINFEEARRQIIKHCRPLSSTKMPLSEARGLVIAKDLHSPLNLPGFNNSAMDGFALRSTDCPGELTLAGVIRAGSQKRHTLKKGQTFAIMTGAMIPAGADAVLEKEKVVVKDNRILITSAVGVCRNMRKEGEELLKGSKLSLAGTTVSPGVIGFLSSLGLQNVPIFPKPRVALVATGDELVRPGVPLKTGQIYDSSTSMLRAALNAIGINPAPIQHVTDSKTALLSVLRHSLENVEAVILTGGISVGDYDYVKEIFKRAGVKEIFWKVKQKPGKPVFFGKKRNVLVFGLPGNPASAHACYYEYVYPALKRLMGYHNVFLREENLPLAQEIKPDPEKTLILKARKINFRKKISCEILRHQGSHMLLSLCQCDGFIVVPPGRARIQAGEQVRFQYLPEA